MRSIIKPQGFSLRFFVYNQNSKSHATDALLHRHVYGMCLIGVKGFAAVKHGYESQVIGALAVQDIRACLKIEHSLDFSLHPFEVFDELRNFVFKFIFDFKKNYMAYHIYSSPGFSASVSAMEEALWEPVLEILNKISSY